MRIVASVGVALALALPGWASPPRRATLNLQSVEPLVVRGEGFGRAERVTVVARYPGAQQIVNLAARQNGRFTAAFTLVVTECAPLTVRAIGAKGSRAILQREPVCARPNDNPKRKPKPPRP
jgi:hypothetical protein